MLKGLKFAKNPRGRGFFDVDPAGIAPASLDTKANMLLYAPRARVHEVILPQKKLLFQGVLSVVSNYDPWYTNLLALFSIANMDFMSRGLLWITFLPMTDYRLTYGTSAKYRARLAARARSR